MGINLNIENIIKGGAGHYVKMIHNGIEYGMMQAIGEGFVEMDGYSDRLGRKAH